MYRYNQLSLPIGYKKSKIDVALALKLKIDKSKLKNVKISRLSVDARDKSNICFKASIDFDVEGKFNFKNFKNVVVINLEETGNLKWHGKDGKIVVVGSGPSGLFCALTLAEAGARVVLLERGYEMSKRKLAVDNLLTRGILDTKSNIQFGEGGAGTFSDGKLNTGIGSRYVRNVLETFHKFGADENILYESKPHVGTDVLSSVIVNMREYLLSLGVEVLFEHRVVDIIVDDHIVTGVKVECCGGMKTIDCDSVIFAIGHSSRDTINMLFDKNIDIRQKPFSLGYRIEHLQCDINESQYGVRECARGGGDVLNLPPAEYKLVEHVGDRVVYSFCMCPGGVVVPATSEEGEVVTNGMSYNARDGINSNSAILVSVTPSDFPSSHPLAGVYWQMELEKSAYSKTRDYRAVVQRVEDFLRGMETKKCGKVNSTYKPGVVCGRVDDMLPSFVVDSIRQALPQMASKLKAFGDGDALLVGIETRSSAPYQIVRDDNMMTNINGVYVIGEGAGFAGGIVSSAVEGIKCANIIIKSFA